MAEVIDDPKSAKAAYSRQYEKLSQEFARVISPRRGMVAEIGCGRGQLTVPLANLLPRVRFQAVDTFAGAYAGTMPELSKALLRAGLKGRVKVYKSDYLDWLWEEYSDRYVAIVSSEFLPEIDSYELSRFMSECFRVLRRGGVTIHSFLSSTPRNNRQRLLIEADSDPRWTETPPKEWFSPKSSQVVSVLRRAEFRNVGVKRIKSNLIIRAKAAQQLLESWDVRRSFWKKYNTRLETNGLEVPDWMIVWARKS